MPETVKRLPRAALYGAFARMWALSEQGIGVSVETASDRHFKVTVSYSNPNVPGGGGGRVWGDDPDNLLDQIEETLAMRGVSFKPSREYLEEMDAQPWQKGEVRCDRSVHS